MFAARYFAPRYFPPHYFPEVGQDAVTVTLVTELTALISVRVMTKARLRDDILARLGDADELIWTSAEVDGHLVEGYEQIANNLGVFYDWTYLENLPRGFSYTQPWERVLLVAFGGFDYGCANFTAEFERGLLDERRQFGPANHTSPFEATDGLLARAGASTEIPATADLPKTVTSVTRVTWDRRGLDAMEARRMARADARYEVTKGEIYGYIWQKDGVRTLRKVRVPSAQSDAVTVNGSWGALRQTSDVSTESVTGTWGVPRRINGQHPIGPDQVGAPRRVFLEGKNVRVEHARQGRPMDSGTAICELPDRYALYLRDYVMAQCLGRRGPGQDMKLAAHFEQRWQRDLARIARRMQTVNAERVGVIGGDGRPSVSRPPRPSLPWQYGRTVR